MTACLPNSVCRPSALHLCQGWEREHAEETTGPLYTDAVLGEQGRLYSARLRDKPSQLARLHTPPALPQVLVHAIRAAAQRLYAVRGPATMTQSKPAPSHSHIVTHYHRCYGALISGASWSVYWGSLRNLLPWMLLKPSTVEKAMADAGQARHAHCWTVSRPCLLQELGLSGVARIDGWVTLDGPPRLQLSEEVCGPA